jgi:hypothetical protein
VPVEPDPRMTELFPSMAGSVFSSAPAEWSEAVLLMEIDTASSKLELSYDTPGGRQSRSSAVDGEAMMALIDVADERGEGFDIELTVRPDESYDAVVSPRIEAGLAAEDSGYMYVLKPDHRPPPYRGAGADPAEAASRDSTEAGDPEAAVRLMREYLARVHAMFGKPLSTDEERPDSLADIRRHLDALERRTGWRCPPICARRTSRYGV